MLGDSAKLFVVGNKTDLEPQRNVPESEAQEYVPLRCNGIYCSFLGTPRR